MKKAIMSVLTVWILVSSMFIGLISFSDIENVQAPYIPHNPIRINSDAEFASMAGIEGWAGNGLPGSPYIIENYDINGSGYGYCIYIGNTTVNFEVRDSYLHEASGFASFPYYIDSGIILYNVENGSVKNNIASSNNRFGIYLQYSDSNNLVNNTPSSNIKNGIYLYSSHSNNITNNTASSNNNWNGIYLQYSHSNNITNNTVSNNANGIYLDYSNSNTIAKNNASSNDKNGLGLAFSSSNTISNNTASSNSENGIGLLHSSSSTITNNEMVDDGILIWGDMLEHWNTYLIDTTNTVNGKPVHYWKNQTGGTVPLDVGQVILANCTNVVIENQNVSHGTVGVELGFSINNTITNTTAFSNNNDGIILSYSSNNNIANNNASNNLDGILIYSSNNNIIINNTAFSNSKHGIYLYSSDNNTIANNTAFINNIQGIFLWYSNHNNITNNTAIYNVGGIFLEHSSNNNITNNNASSNNGLNGNGITLLFSNSNTIANNIVSSNNWHGIYIEVPDSPNNRIYHNSIMNNSIQAFDDTINGNQWDNSYPLGGNYWSDYSGYDNFSGPNQDITGSDGIGDTPYVIDADSQDNYPLMEPFTNRTFENYTVLKQGWNLISIPLIQQNESLKKVLEMIDGYYDSVQWYNSSDPNKPWKHHKIGKPFGNDLSELNESMSFWIHIINPGDTIFLYNGTQPTSNQSIPLHPGWNMVGYPSLTNRNRTAALNNLTFGVEVDAIWTFNAATQKWEEIGIGDYFEVGRGYWVHAAQECVWEVGV